MRISSLTHRIREGMKLSGISGEIHGRCILSCLAIHLPNKKTSVIRIADSGGRGKRYSCVFTTLTSGAVHKRSPSASVTRVRFPYLASHVG